MPTSDTPATSPAQQPPYLKHVRLRNVPPLRDVEADFKPGLNVIIGKNGSGKTRFMSLLFSLTEPYEEKYEGLDCGFIIAEKHHELSVTFRKNSPAETVSSKLGSMRLAESRHALLTVMSIGAVEEQDEKPIEALAKLSFRTGVSVINFDYHMVTVWHGLPNYRLPILDESVDLALEESSFLRVVGDGMARWHNTSRLVTSLFRTIEEGRDQYFSERSMHDIFDVNEVHELISSCVQVHLERINNYLPVYSPLQGVRLNDQYQVYKNSSNRELLVKGLSLEYEIGGDWLPYSALSDGTKRVLFLIGEMVTPSFTQWDEAKKAVKLYDFNKIILLEEPELGIHPDQLQLLLQLIREVSRKHQVILTTHSPQTLDMLNRDELDRITICEYVPGKGTQMRKLSAAKQAKARAYLKDEGFLSEFWRFSNLEDPD